MKLAQNERKISSLTSPSKEDILQCQVIKSKALKYSPLGCSYDVIPKDCASGKSIDRQQRRRTYPEVTAPTVIVLNLADSAGFGSPFRNCVRCYVLVCLCLHKHIVKTSSVRIEPNNLRDRWTRITNFHRTPDITFGYVNTSRPIGRILKLLSGVAKRRKEEAQCMQRQNVHHAGSVRRQVQTSVWRSIPSSFETPV